MSIAHGDERIECKSRDRLKEHRRWGDQRPERFVVDWDKGIELERYTVVNRTTHKRDNIIWMFNVNPVTTNLPLRFKRLPRLSNFSRAPGFYRPVNTNKSVREVGASELDSDNPCVRTSGDDH